jgi:hypothetical protein
MVFFKRNIKAFFDGLFHAQEIFKSTTHNQSAPHQFDHDISIPSPDGRIFMVTALFQQAKMKGDVADNLVSRCHCSQRTTD